MRIVKKLLVATAAATVVGMVDANRANAVSVNYESFDPSTGEYKYNFTLSPLEVDAFIAETTVAFVTIAADKFKLTGMAGVNGQAVSGTADSFYRVNGTTSTSAEWVVDQTIASTATLLAPNQTSFGTFTVTAPGTQLGTINYSVETTVSGILPSADCPVIGVRSTCTGTTQGPVAAAAVPFELSPGLGSLALGVSGAIAYLKSLKKRKSFESELQKIDAN